MEFFSKSRLEKAQAALGELAKLEAAEAAKILTLQKRIAALEAQGVAPEGPEGVDLRSALLARSKEIASLKNELTESKTLLPVLGSQRVRAVGELYSAQYEEARKPLKPALDEVNKKATAYDKARAALDAAEKELSLARAKAGGIQRTEEKTLAGNYSLAALLERIDSPEFPAVDREYFKHCERRGLHCDYTFQIDAAGRIENPAPETAFND